MERRMAETPARNATHTTDRELATSRLIDAPPERVFKAFSDPLHLAQWWGPNGFTNSFDEFDFRPGGRWRFVMQGPDGRKFVNESLFLEIVASERVVLRHESAPQFELTITFQQMGAKTVVGWRQVFNTESERDRIAQFALQANEQNLDRLAAHIFTVG
jgi:uncharacterized protein YndB with AHSA1/START domain